MIEVRDLVKRYGDRNAVDHLSFTVEDGQIFGFLGPNGAGKTTTMNIMTGYLAATGGQVLVEGHDILEEPEAAKACIGYLPELPPLYPDMTVEEYLAFWQELTHAQEAEVHGFEDRNVFEGCMPVEVMARRGEDTLRYGPLKPRGLKDPRTGREPYAVVQLRKDNADGTIYNLVGFQTHLRFPEQKRVFSMIPALHDAKFLRYGVMHRNTYLDSPRLLDRYYRLKARPRIAFAGQMTGVEGYVESCASGFLVGVETARRLLGQAPMDFPRETAIGALGLYVSNESVTQFQPMNINFGIMPPLDHRVKGKRNKNAELSQRSLAIIEQLKQEVLNYEDHH